MRKTLGLLFAICVFTFIVFYFWASSPSIDSTEYQKLSSSIDEEITEDLDDTITVISYNLGYLSGMMNNLAVERNRDVFKKNGERISSIIHTINPDIIGFQEIDINADRSFNIDQVASIVANSSLKNSYTSVNWDKKYVPFPYWPIRFQFGKILSGQAIVTRFNIEEAETEKLIKPINAPFYYNDFYLDRLIQIAQLDIKGQIVIVINVHLEAFDKETRQFHMEMVKQCYLKYSKSYPVILMGDFNSNYDDKEKGIRSLLASPNIKACYDFSDDSIPLTFSSEKPTLLLDYIFYNENWVEKVDMHVLTEAGQVSDHLPVMMRFFIKDKNAL